MPYAVATLFGCWASTATGAMRVALGFIVTANAEKVHCRLYCDDAITFEVGRRWSVTSMPSVE